MKLVVCLAFIFSIHLCKAQCPNLLWSDEFLGSSLDLNKWSYQTGDGCTEGICGWGNNELQDYETSNVVVSNGLLQITADREQLRGRRYRYTSGRIRSINKGDWTYGRFEARIKLPQGGGLWPAFWMLSTNEPYGGWPRSGEIDIMEFVGNTPSNTLGYIHYANSNGDALNQGSTFPFYDPNFLNEFHEFAIEWEANEIRWFVDGYLFQTKTTGDLDPEFWPFNQDMHFLLNVAVGGNLGGTVDDSIFPSTMEVEYVRVYDAGRAYIAGDRFIEYQGSSAYSIGNVPGNTNVTWSVPAGATIVSGQGTPNITISWGTSDGQITALVSTACGTETFVVNTLMAPPYTKDFSFENFDEPANASYVSSDGSLSEVTNPNPNALNSSALSAEYIRNSSALFDNIVYSTSMITDAAQYVNGNNRFYLDVLTSAPSGTEIIIQLENSTANSTNFPDGRHSRYFGTTEAVNSWHRIYFNFADRPDGGAADNSVSKLLILFNSNTLSGDTYYYDNLDSYSVDTGGNTSPTVSITSPSDGANFNDGQSISIDASASDSDGSVTQVEFFVNGTSVGVDATSPYSVNWTVSVGSFELTAEATDNGGASTLSSIINVNGQPTGNASEIYVNSIITGTQAAGQGNKRGTATITILNDLGQPEANATVSGTFIGTFAETVIGVTGSDGTVQLVTSGTTKGNASVDLCVDNVTHGSLTYNSSLNIITCTGSGGARIAGSKDGSINGDLAQKGVLAYPNPFQNEIIVHITIEKTSLFSAKLYGLDGRILNVIDQTELETGHHKIPISLSGLESGIYFFYSNVNNEQNVIKMIKR